MKTILRITLLGFLFITLNIQGQNKLHTVKDSITFFYNDLFEKLETKYLKREEVNWNSIKPFIINNATKSESFEKSLHTVPKLLDTIGCNHCELFADTGSYKSTLNKALYADDFSEDFITKLQDNSGYEFEVKLIKKNIGYINMPGMLLINIPQDSLNLKTQKMYDTIIHLKDKESVKGWVIDLRFNIGGNAYVMLTALYDLLGDSVVYNSMDTHGKIIGSNRLENGTFYSNDSLKAKVEVRSKPNLKIPVALITGKMTGSAGEDIAVAFKNRKDVIFIGEPTYGLLTGNDMFELPFNNKIALTLSYVVDEENKYREYITPDIEISKKDNFKDLTKDENIIRAFEFFDKKE
ncbi:S41 family peptidase [Croceitalea marina]|uniref:S41 family peptidase n=1 Tax=Croceitalea marina TaxID=1775166 RepID=A0ABW5MUE9_9FLAO